MLSMSIRAMLDQTMLQKEANLAFRLAEMTAFDHFWWELRHSKHVFDTTRVISNETLSWTCKHVQ